MKYSFAVCVRNQGYEVSLELCKIYRVLPDLKAAQHHQIRVIDESGEDYLYPEKCFSKVALPSETKEKLVEMTAA